jgi:hypothetical protein
VTDSGVKNSDSSGVAHLQNPHTRRGGFSSIAPWRDHWSGKFIYLFLMRYLFLNFWLRGEFLGILILRSVILSGTILGFAIFSLYSIILIPLQLQIRSNVLSARFNLPWEYVEEDSAVIIIVS